MSAIPSPDELASDVPMGVPDLGVLHDDPIVELEFWARELGPVFFDLLRVLQPLLHVSSKLRVCDPLIVHEGAFYQLFVRLSSATSFEPIFGNIDVPLGIY